MKAAYTANNRLDCAIQRVESLLQFQGFSFVETPNACLCAGGVFILEYRGKAIFVEEALELMETRGYIVPEDFKL